MSPTLEQQFGERWIIDTDGRVCPFDRTSHIGSDVESNVRQYPDCHADPKAAGRLDELTFLLERCHSGNTWPWRIANGALSWTRPR